MTAMLPRTKIPELLRLLRARYAGVTTALDYKSPFQLLVATILSAQCTDKRVNMVTPSLFARYPSPKALAGAEIEDVEELVRTTGFFHNKAKNIIAMSRVLIERHGGEVPRSMEELVELPGVARKTANVVLGTCFGIASGVVVDTHVARVAQLLGLTAESDATRIERDLMELVPRDEWVLFGHMLIHHGREICVARRPNCDACPLNRLCVSAFVAPGYVGERAAKRAERGQRATDAKVTGTKARAPSAPRPGPHRGGPAPQGSGARRARGRAHPP